MVKVFCRKVNQGLAKQKRIACPQLSLTRLADSAASRRQQKWKEQVLYIYTCLVGKVFSGAGSLLCLCSVSYSTSRLQKVGITPSFEPKTLLTSDE